MASSPMRGAPGAEVAAPQGSLLAAMVLRSSAGKRIRWAAKMDDIHRSTDAYEAWLRHRLGGELVEKGLARKHEKMRKDAFSFLRATYWRWAETVLIVCPGAADAPPV